MDVKITVYLYGLWCGNVTVCVFSPDIFMMSHPLLCHLFTSPPLITLTPSLLVLTHSLTASYVLL